LNTKISKLLNKKYSFITSNCSSAIFLLLKSLNFKSKKILIPGNVCFDVMLSIIYSQNIPVVVDTNKNLGFSLIDLKKEIKKQKNISAIIFPYVYGNSENFKSVSNLIKKKNILLIEDIAGSFGGKIGNKRFGMFSDFCVGSFGQGKIIDMGKGGFFATNNKEVFEKFISKYKQLKIYSPRTSSLYNKLNLIIDSTLKSKTKKNSINFKKLKKYFSAIIYRRKFNNDYNLKLNKQISNIDKINKLRNLKAEKFTETIKFKSFKSITHRNGSVYWRKNFLLNHDSSKLILFLNKKGIYARKYYPPLNLIFLSVKKKLRNCEKTYSQIINFWVGEETNLKDILKIKHSIQNYYNACKTTTASS
jgi:dTDP-4-amino-4,6-dideoxygalactose transaminase